MSKKPDVSVFIEVLRTLADQGGIDVEPTEREYDLTKIYNWLVSSGLAWRTDDGPYWLYVVPAQEEACEELAGLLEELSSTIRIEMSLEDAKRIADAVNEAFTTKKQGKIYLTVGLSEMEKGG